MLANTCASTSSKNFAHCFWPANVAIRTRWRGRSANSACLSSIIGGRRKPVGPSARTLPDLELLPVKPGSCGKAVPGYDVQVLNDEGAEVGENQIGNIVIKLPLPPGCFPTLWNNDAGYLESYIDSYPGYYKTADAGFKDEDGYLWIMSRTDDIINVAGHRLSTGALEEVLAAHADVAECAVIGVADEIKGEVPLGLVVLKRGVERSQEEIVAELIRDGAREDWTNRLFQSGDYREATSQDAFR